MTADKQLSWLPPVGKLSSEARLMRVRQTIIGKYAPHPPPSAPPSPEGKARRAADRQSWLPPVGKLSSEARLMRARQTICEKVIPLFRY